MDNIQEKIDELSVKIEALSESRALFEEVLQDDELDQETREEAEKDLAEVIQRISELEQKVKQCESQKNLVNELPNLPKLDVRLHKKSGICQIFERGNADGCITIFMNAMDYTKNGLKLMHEFIENNEKIVDSDKKYLPNIDPTLYNIYFEYDIRNQGKYNDLATRKYVNAVIEKSKQWEQGEYSAEFDLPGNIDIDIGYHPKIKDLRIDKPGFSGIKYLAASYRANQILRFHGKNKLDLATVRENTIAELFEGNSQLTLAAVSVENEGK